LEYCIHNYYVIVATQDQLTKDMLVVVNVYIPPNGSKHCNDVYESIMDNLTESIDALLLRLNNNTPVVVVGDFNARVGTMQCSHLPNLSSRKTCDYTLNPRGKILM
jgi:exonuclease III